MRAPLYFKRSSGGQTPGSDSPQLGTATDPVPTVSTTKRSPGGTNPIFEFRDVNVDRVFVGYWYEGGGGAVTLPVTLYVWDEASQKYYSADSGTLTNGKLTYLKCPCPLSPPQNSSNTPQPNNAQHCLVIVSDNTAPAGLCHFIAGQDGSNF